MRLAKPSRMAASVWEEIHRRLKGFFQLARAMIQRATSSPSRPASVAITSSLMSERCISSFTAANWCDDCLMTFNFMRGGIIGRSSRRHCLYFWS